MPKEFVKSREALHRHKLQSKDEANPNEWMKDPFNRRNHWVKQPRFTLYWYLPWNQETKTIPFFVWFDIKTANHFIVPISLDRGNYIYNTYMVSAELAGRKGIEQNIILGLSCSGAVVKNPIAIQRTWVPSLVGELRSYISALCPRAWKIPHSASRSCVPLTKIRHGQINTKKRERSLPCLLRSLHSSSVTMAQAGWQLRHLTSSCFIDYTVFWYIFCWDPDIEVSF